MIDLIGSALHASSVRNAWSVPLVFAAGTCTSVGPCVVPRFIAAAGLSAGKHERGGMTPVISFVFGLIFAYASFGAIAALVGRLLQFSTAIYALLALAMACCGTALLWREPRTECGNGRGAGHHTGAGAAFLLGASFALVVSPCCTPIVLGIIAYTSASGDPLYGSTLLAVFALGHALPVLCVGAGAQRLALILSNGIVKHAVSTTAAALMFALAAYYAVLA